MQGEDSCQVCRENYSLVDLARFPITLQHLDNHGGYVEVPGEAHRLCYTCAERIFERPGSSCPFCRRRFQRPNVPQQLEGSQVVAAPVSPPVQPVQQCEFVIRRPNGRIRRCTRLVLQQVQLPFEQNARQLCGNCYDNVQRQITRPSLEQQQAARVRQKAERQREMATRRAQQELQMKQTLMDVGMPEALATYTAATLILRGNNGGARGRGRGRGVAVAHPLAEQRE